MAQIRYDIVQGRSGWCIACGEVVGPAYNRRMDALSDAIGIAKLLRSSGDDVEVYVEERGGPRRVIPEPEAGNSARSSYA